MQPDEVVIGLEKLARAKAAYDFLKQVRFSLEVWRVDELIRANCQSPVEWIKEFTTLLEQMVTIKGG